VGISTVTGGLGDAWCGEGVCKVYHCNVGHVDAVSDGDRSGSTQPAEKQGDGKAKGNWEYTIENVGKEEAES